MLPIFSVVSASYVLIDMVLALVALAVGFFAALWYVRNVSGLNSNADSEGAAKEKETLANKAERANMAAMQLQDLAKNVATDVGTHNTVIADISENLSEAKQGGNAENVVVDAVSQIMTANEKLQARLADAEQKIQAQAEELSNQQTEARTDALTKLPNRRAFDDSLKQCYEKFVSQKQPFSMMIFDVDHFKNFNDTHGHQAGDEVLRKVGDTLLNVVKHEDVPCRYGGEEFALIMPSTQIAQARIAAERVRKAIEGMDVVFEEKELKVTASIGVAEIESEEQASLLVRRADDAVYAAKNAGRNCGYWHDGEDCRSLDDTAPPKPAPTTPVASEPAPEVSEEATLEDGDAQTVLHSDLPDKAVFSGELHRRINESHRFGAALSLIHLRVKRYVELEKEYGDAVGRLLLDTAVHFIRSLLRGMDLLGKLDDGEFVVMLPGSSEKQAKVVSDRVQEASEKCLIPLGDRQLQVEFALGVTAVQPDDEAPVMLARAKEVTEQNEDQAATVC